MAVQMLYQGDLGRAEVREVLSRFDPHGVFRAEVEEFEDEERSEEAPRAEAEVLRAAFDYARDLALGAEARLSEIDELIKGQAENWRLERMAPVDRNILRLAVYELLAEDEVPKVVVLDEAIELAKKYGSEQSSSFVNGVLDGLLKRHRFPGRMT